MFQKDSFTDDRSTTDGFESKVGQNAFSELRNTRNQYDKLDEEAKTSTQYIPRTYYCATSKCDYKLGNHFQDLNEKFQELETKMIEVEKCFKEANQRDLNEPPRASESNDFKASPETVPIVQQSRLYGMSECRKETNEFPSDGIKAWFVPHRSTVTEKNKFQSRIVRDGSGDGPQPNEMFSDDSFETLIKSTEKPVQLPNRQAAKGIFTIHRFDSRQEHGTSKNYTCKDSSTSGNDVDFLEKSKKLILTLIDKELNRIETNQKHYSPPTNATNPLVTKLDNLQDAKRSSLKMECISNIEKELETLKKLELSDQ